MGHPWEMTHFTMENHGKSMGNHGKSWKIMENQWEIMENHWEMWVFHKWGYPLLMDGFLHGKSQ
jgi:hypothetical protein